MMSVAVLSASGIRLMPTTAYRARRLLKAGKAEIFSYKPIFTIKLLYRNDGKTQPMEYKCDTGYQHIGVSIATEKKEVVNEQRDLLPDEKSRHADSRKLRRSRRNRLRYRKPRWHNRKGLICKDGFAPSIRNKRNVHTDLFSKYNEVLPITKAVFEMGQFDTQVLKAIEEGKPLPEGIDYQRGEQYGYATLREAVFNRDNYKCIICGKSAITDKAILRIHHLGYLNHDRSNRMSNLATVCTKCHTAKNHQPGGKLYGLKPKLKAFKGATFMSSVRYSMIKELRETAPDIPVAMTYGAATKLARQALGIKKSHGNDAYCMGNFHPKHRTDFRHYKKKRRNNRILDKFYDSKHIDARTGKPVNGSALSCGRTNRSEPRNSIKNERIFRGQKISQGRISHRFHRYNLQPGDKVLINGKTHSVNGTHCNGTRVLIDTGESIACKNVKLKSHAGGWVLSM